MTNREKALHGLNSCGNDYGVPNICEITECPYRGTGVSCVHDLARDAMKLVSELLKEQTPRVVTLDEIKEGEPYWLGVGKEFVMRPVICVHREDDAQKPYITFAWQFGTFAWGTEDYGKAWRCWTARPTEEQGMAAELE